MDKYDKNVPTEYDGLFQKAADANGVSYDLLRKVAWTESRFKPTAKSKTGPLGMMQFTKATAKAMGLKVTGVMTTNVWCPNWQSTLPLST